MEWKTKVEKSLTRWGGAQSLWALSVIVRNFIMVNVFPRRPIRSCLKKSGPGRTQLYEQAEKGDERAENGHSQGGGNAVEEFRGQAETFSVCG